MFTPPGVQNAVMEPLDLRTHRLRSARATMLGFVLLPRTIDKLRAELPGGNLGPYLNLENGFSAYVIRRLGLAMDELRAAVAAAPDETAVEAWLAARIDLTHVPALNAKVASLVFERMSAEDQRLARERHPVLERRPELSVWLDILDADDESTYGVT